MNLNEITKTIIAIIIVGGAIASLFIAGISDVGARLLQSLATFVVGYYFGTKNLPLVSGFFGKKKK